MLEPGRKKYEVMALQQIPADKNCLVCQETINNPLCQDCLALGIKEWLNEKELNEVLTGMEFERTHDSAMCIMCGKPVGICTYCFTKEVYELIKEKHSELVKEYLKFFNFDLEHKGYEYDAILNNLI